MTSICDEIVMCPYVVSVSRTNYFNSQRNHYNSFFPRHFISCACLMKNLCFLHLSRALKKDSTYYIPINLLIMCANCWHLNGNLELISLG